MLVRTNQPILMSVVVTLGVARGLAVVYLWIKFGLTLTIHMQILTDLIRVIIAGNPGLKTERMLALLQLTVHITWPGQP